MGDLENTISPLDQVDFDCEATLQLVRQTGGAGKIVSNYTVFDRDRSHDVLASAADYSGGVQLLRAHAGAAAGPGRV